MTWVRNLTKLGRKSNIIFDKKIKKVRNNKIGTKLPNRLHKDQESKSMYEMSKMLRYDLDKNTVILLLMKVKHIKLLFFHILKL